VEADIVAFPDWGSHLVSFTKRQGRVPSVQTRRPRHDQGGSKRNKGPLFVIGRTVVFVIWVKMGKQKPSNSLPPDHGTQEPSPVVSNIYPTNAGNIGKFARNFISGFDRACLVGGAPGEMPSGAAAVSLTTRLP